MSDNLFLHEDATWTTPAGGGGDFVVTKVTLTPTDMATIDGGGSVTIIPGVADKIIFPMFFSIIYVPGADTYDNNAWEADFKYGEDGVQCGSESPVDLTGTGIYSNSNFDNLLGEDTGQLVGEDIVIQGSAVAPTGPDPGNVIIVLSSYVVDPT